MNASLKRLERASFGMLAVFLTVLFAYLFGYSMLYTCRIDTAFIAAEKVLFETDLLWLNIVRVFAGLVLCWGMVRLGDRIPVGAFTAACLGLTFALGCSWVLLHRGMPINDTGILHYTAAEMVRGNPSELWRHEIYMRTNPHQAGYLQYSEMMQRIFGRNSTIPQGILNTAYLCGAYGAVLSLAWQSFHDRDVQRLTALMLLACIQPVFYTSFLYGNLPGLCAALWAVCALMRGWKQKIWFVISCILLCIAVMLKPNYLILAFALFIVLVIHCISARRCFSLLLAVCMLTAPALSAKGVQYLLQMRTGFDMGKGAPQTVWLAMGMQESTRAPGWYNHYPTNTMEKANCDVEQVEQTARADIASRAAVFAANPAYAADFYHKKLVSQWSETTFEIGFTNAVMENRSKHPQLVERILTGDLSEKLAGYLEGCTLVLYLSFAAGCALLMLRLKHCGITWQQLMAPAILLTTVFGGFLYHMLFEAKSQYVLFYLPLMIPIAAWGLKTLMAKRS